MIDVKYLQDHQFLKTDNYAHEKNLIMNLNNLQPLQDFENRMSLIKTWWKAKNKRCKKKIAKFAVIIPQDINGQS